MVSLKRNWRKGESKRDVITALLFLIPSLVFLLYFWVWPIIITFYVSLHHVTFMDYWNSGGRIFGTGTFVGLANYWKAIHDPQFIYSLILTVNYAILVIPLSILFSLVLALLLFKGIRSILSTFRTIYYLPVLTNVVATVVVWSQLFSSRYGPISNFLAKIFHISSTWFTQNPLGGLLTVTLMSIWNGAGYNMVIFLSGLQAVPRSLYEAAEIDGADWWDKFWKVTIPSIKPTMFFIVITSTIGALQAFAQFQVFFPPGSQPMISFMGQLVYGLMPTVYYIYAVGWNSGIIAGYNMSLGYAAAMSYILFGIILAIGIFQIFYLRRR